MSEKKRKTSILSSLFGNRNKEVESDDIEIK